MEEKTIANYIDFVRTHLTKTDEVQKSFPITYEGRKGYLVLSKKKLLFVQEKGLFGKSYDTLIDAPYKKIEGVKATDTQHLELTYDGKTHYFTSSGGITTPLIEQGLREVM